MFKELLVFSLIGSASLKADLFDWFHSLSPKAERAQEIMKEFEPVLEIALSDYQVPGIAIGLIVDGEVAYAKGFGYRDLEKQLPVTPETIFAVGSCTKAFTSFLVGMFVEEGELQWDTPLVETLPGLHLWDFEVTNYLSFRDVLTHRSGLPRHEFLWYNAKMDRETLLKKLKYLEPACRLRQRYIYNSIMYLAAGMGLENISGKKWEDLVTERILKPLSMKYTSFSIDEMKKSSDYAFPYFERGDHQLQKMAFRDLSLVGPGASMNSNVEDLCHWIKMHLARGTYGNKVLIQPSTLQEMLIPQVITTSTPETQDTSFSAYGLGWHISSYRGHYVASHDGISDGFTSVVAFLPHDNIGIIILVNKNLTALPRFLSFQILDRILELPPIDWLKEGFDGLQKTKATDQENKNKEEPTRKIGTHPSHSLADYTGDYENAAYGILSVDLLGQKLRVLYNDIPYILDHFHYDVFSVGEEPIPSIISFKGGKFSFRNNINGEVAEVSFPFEPAVKDIVFHRKHDSRHASVAYLRQFIGQYEIYGYTVDVTLRNGVLFAIIPGQPVYELIPTIQNEFNVKSKTGFNVRFVMDENNGVKEVLLMQPYGTFSAKPKSRQ